MPNYTNLKYRIKDILENDLAPDARNTIMREMPSTLNVSHQTWRNWIVIPLKSRKDIPAEQLENIAFHLSIYQHNITSADDLKNFATVAARKQTAKTA